MEYHLQILFFASNSHQDFQYNHYLLSLYYLQHAEANSFDIVYFDPMFQEGIEESNGINAIRKQAITSDITAEIIEEAKRVAKERVVLKDHWKSKRFQELGFTQFKRKTSLFHYGTIELR